MYRKVALSLGIFIISCSVLDTDTSKTLDVIKEGLPSTEYTFPQGTSLTLVAEPNEGFRFLYWEEDRKVIGDSLNLTYIMPGKDVVITAVFVKKLPKE
jgi:hypothetical protein